MHVHMHMHMPIHATCHMRTCTCVTELPSYCSTALLWYRLSIARPCGFNVRTAYVFNVP